MPLGTCGDQRATLWGQFSSSTFIWVQGINSDHQAWVANALRAESSHWSADSFYI